MSNLKFFLIAILPAAGVILIGLYFLPLAWSLGVLLLTAIVLGLFFISAKTVGGAKAGTAPTVSAEVSQDELSTILNNFGDTLIIYDENFKILFFNAAGEKLFMVPASEISGMTVKPEAVDNPRLRLLAQVIFPTLAPVMIPRSQPGTWPQIVDISFTVPQLELRVSTSQLARIAGEPARFLKVIQNRTHEMALIKTKNDFVTVASHQLKTPLTYMNWALEALNDDTALSDSNKELVSGAFKAGHLLAEIVESLLNIAKIEEGRFGYKFEETKIEDFLNQVLSQAMPQANKAGIRLYFEKPQSALPPVFIDSQRLALAVSNLIDNAVRYNVKNGEVVVRAEQVPGRPFIEVSVKDTGIGIPPEEVQKLFTKFFRAENAVKSQTEGTGLGLYIAKNIIEGHGGEVRVESELGRGTTFFVTLPTDQSLVPQREIPQDA
ncbi:MAG TPA: PAS domain-containing sensor histidine kinase [Candidatus Paceibacterota bacterium]|nr:PAS domain-containing sensor histidine kinase [Candidatus Paceibacterota bacterium]